MANFDPPVQSTVQDAGEFLRWSKPIQDIPANLSGAKALEGATTAIEAGAKGLNKFAEEEASDVGYKAGETLAGDYGSQVQAVHDTLIPQDADPNVPKPVQEGVDSIKQIQAARDQGSAPAHIRETNYLRQLYQTASALRAQWPGYREYIDKGIEKATGITPNANQYIKSMIADINDVLSKKNSETEKVSAHVLSQPAFPGRADIYQNLKDGKITGYDALKATDNAMSFEYFHKVSQAQLTDLERDDKAKKNVATTAISGYVPGALHTALSADLAKLGFTDEKIQQISDNPSLLKPEEWDALDQHLGQFAIQFRNQMDTQFSQPLKDRNGNTVPGVRVSAGEEYSKKMDEAMTEVRMWRDAIHNPENGRIGIVARANKAIVDRTSNNIWNTNTDASRFLQATEIFNKFGGQGFAATILGPDAKGMLGVSVPRSADMVAFMGNAMGGSQTPGLATMKSTLGAINNVPGGAKPQEVSAYMNFPIASVMNSQVPDPAKINVLRHVFTGQDNNWLTNVNDDYFTDKGERINGKHGVFLAYSQPTFRDEIARLSNTDPKLWTQYQDWMKTTFTNDLFSKDISRLNQYQKLGSQEGVDVVWRIPSNKSQPPGFVAVPRPGLGTAYMATQVNRSLTDLNQGIAAMHNVFGENTTPQLMELFRQFGGLDTTGAVRDNNGGMLLTAIGASKKPVEGSSKNQDQAPGVKVHRQSVMNQPNPSMNTNIQGQEGTPSGRAPWTMDQSPGYQFGQELVNRLGNISEDARHRIAEAIKHPNYDQSLQPFMDLFGRK